MDSTSKFGFAKVGPGDKFSDESYKFSTTDRDMMDQLIWLGAEGHHHVGNAAIDAIADPPTLSLDLTRGIIPASTRLYYVLTYVDANGLETAASAETYIDTPPAIDSPDAPNLVVSDTGGTLAPGNYYYVLTAYTGNPDSAQESVALNPSFAHIPFVPGVPDTHTNTLTLPPLPSGADGFIVYRRAPGGARYVFMAAIDMQVATPPTQWVDNGSIAENPNRWAPIYNTTQSRNSVLIGLPGATPVLPGGYVQWRIYRSIVSGDYRNSLLATLPASTTSYLDLGEGTTVGQPPFSGQSVGTPSKIQLEDGLEVQGHLPRSFVDGFPVAESFSFSGALTVTAGEGVWVCPFPKARLLGVICSLGRGSTPAAQPVLVDVNKGSGATPTYTTVFTDQTTRPRVLTGRQVGPMAAPQVIELVEGDSLTVDVDQTGGGATPTDSNLTVTVYMVAYDYTDTDSMEW